MKSPLADAERDGDRIYAVIKGIGSSSDGKDKGLTAPRPEGQARALRRAYAKANFSPATVGLIEAHGTGTVAGDRAEVRALTDVFSEAQAPPQRHVPVQRLLGLLTQRVHLLGAPKAEHHGVSLQRLVADELLRARQAGARAVAAAVGFGHGTTVKTLQRIGAEELQVLLTLAHADGFDAACCPSLRGALPF